MVPTYEKYFLPKAHIEPRATHIRDLEHLSWRAADYDLEYLSQRAVNYENTTERLNLTFDAEFIDSMAAQVRSAVSIRIGRSDAFGAYLISRLQLALDKPVNYVHHLVTV